MADQGFAVPGSSYKELIKIIQGYAQIDKEAVPSEVGALIGMHESQVSRSNKFLVSVGIVQGGRQKKITSVGSSLAHALEHDIVDEVAKKWREISEGNEFLQKVVAAVRIRKGMDESSLEAHVAYSAGQPKTPTVMAGARTIVEILRISGILREEAGNLVAASGTDARPDPKSAEPEIPPQVSEDESQSPAPPVIHRIEREYQRALPQLNVTVQICVNCTASELDQVGAKLRKMFQELSGSSETANGTQANDDALLPGQD